MDRPQSLQIFQQLRLLRQLHLPQILPLRPGRQRRFLIRLSHIGVNG